MTAALLPGQQERLGELAAEIKQLQEIGIAYDDHKPRPGTIMAILSNLSPIKEFYDAYAKADEAGEVDAEWQKLSFPERRLKVAETLTSSPEDASLLVKQAELRNNVISDFNSLLTPYLELRASNVGRAAAALDRVVTELDRMVPEQRERNSKPDESEKRLIEWMRSDEYRPVAELVRKASMQAVNLGPELRRFANAIPQTVIEAETAELERKRYRPVDEMLS